MLEVILQSLRDVDGVQGAMLVDPSAAVIAYRAHTIYDLSLLQQVARSVVNSADSVQLIQDDWDLMTVHFGEGKLLLRNLRMGGTKPRRYVLTVIADGTLNVAFLGVALRVAASKLISALESETPTTQSQPIPIAVQGTGTGRVAPSDRSRPELAKVGLAWTGASSASSVGSSMGASDVGVTDPASSSFLSACTKALAASLGPMAKVFVKEAVRKMCGDRPFARADGPALLAELASAIEDANDRAAFQRATRAL